MLHLIWNQNSLLLRGWDGSQWVEGELKHGITHPDRITDSKEVTLQSSARVDQTFDRLENVKLFLSGDPEELQVVQSVWPTVGGGIEISFNGGRTYQRFDSSYGYEANPATWVLLPAEAIGLNGVAGKLGPFDSARFLLRYRIPAGALQFGVYQVRLEADFDIV